MMKNLNRESDQYIQVSCDVSQHQLEMYVMETEKNTGATVAQDSQSFSSGLFISTRSTSGDIVRHLLSN